MPQDGDELSEFANFGGKAEAGWHAEVPERLTVKCAASI